MIFEKTEIEGVVIVEPKVIGDNRGWFYESYSKKDFEEYGINAHFIQDNRSFSAKAGTLRGLHCQKNPRPQAKLVSCTKGKIIDVAVDIRKGSPSYLKWVAVELSEENKKMLFIPKGCLHGFLTISDDVELSYKVDDFYSPENDRSVCWCDPEIGVEWPIPEGMEIILSEKDKVLHSFKELENV